ncbi:MAG: hypothetical protein S4CHLAM6_14790 [Chlamydiae bacterium]|nr:hypothetical protein [Chlamydiota bacterium]
MSAVSSNVPSIHASGSDLVPSEVDPRTYSTVQDVPTVPSEEKEKAVAAPPKEATDPRDDDRVVPDYSVRV